MSVNCPKSVCFRPLFDRFFFASSLVNFSLSSRYFLAVPSWFALGSISFSLGVGSGLIVHFSRDNRDIISRCSLTVPSLFNHCRCQWLRLRLWVARAPFPPPFPFYRGCKNRQVVTQKFVFIGVLSGLSTPRNALFLRKYLHGRAPVVIASILPRLGAVPLDVLLSLSLWGKGAAFPRC